MQVSGNHSLDSFFFRWYCQSVADVNPIRIRHVKCDEAQPRCQRCVSTGRTCDGYGNESPTSPVSLSSYALASRPRNISLSEDIQERRSFDFFRNETFPSIVGFFSTPIWNLVLQACNTEPAVCQAVIALGALQERCSIPLKADGDERRPIETSFPIQQYAKALGELRRYMCPAKGLDLNIILLCALIHMTIEVIQNNYLNALVHLENSLHLLQSSRKDRSSPRLGIFNDGIVDSDLARAFLRFDLHASTFQGMRPPFMTENQTQMQTVIPGRFSSLIQAKDVLDQLTGQLYFLVRSTVEDYKYRKLEDLPLDAVTEGQRLKNEFIVWDQRFAKYLNRSTSKFSRQEQVIVDVILINHRIGLIEASTCTQPEETFYDKFDNEFDELVTLAANVLHARKGHTSKVLDFSLDIGIIHPLFCTAVNCREPWIRQRAMTLLRSITFQEGVWNATMQASIAQVAVDRENLFSELESVGGRPKEFARVHSVGTVIDPAKRIAEVDLTQKLNGLDGPWHDQIEFCTW